MTVTWPSLLAAACQGLPWAGPLTCFGKPGLFVIKEEAASPLSVSLSLTPSASGSLLKVQPQKGPAASEVNRWGTLQRSTCSSVKEGPSLPSPRKVVRDSHLVASCLGFDC